MSKAVNSPTARLLQSSRLFSLPRPLPAPDLSSGTSGTFRSSDTATTPYPTHQAISSPASSLHRGDWGLKRSLPRKKLRGTDPTVRIRAQDTWEHVTSFESAGDHVRTLQKWGQMGIPMLIQKDGQRGRGPGASYGYMKPQSVYDEAYDITDKNAPSADGEQGRWKYSGPWLSGMQEGEFQQWLLQQVRKRQGEWNEFLRQQETDRRVRKALSEARDQGEPLSAEQVQELRTASRPTDQELVDIQKELRDAHAQDRLSSDLTALITTFLDLPGAPTEQVNGSNESFMDAVMMSAGLSTERGPPSTHPGAGLSHIRTNAIMENHPIHGPQASRSPIQARVVRPHVTAGMATEQYAKLGVGGVVANDALTATMQRGDSSKNKHSTDLAHAMDPNLPGGGKIWVHPRSASVDEKGRIVMNLVRADSEAVAVKTGEGLEDIHEQKRQGSTTSTEPVRGPEGGGARYGTQLPGRPRAPPQQGQVRQRPNVEGFDKELGESRTAGATGVAEILRRGL